MMDGFLVMESQLIKVEVEGNTNFHCIVCKAEFVSRTERNDHLETHFVHRNCTHCSRQVIVIGDLEFELHQPTHCLQNGAVQDEQFETSDAEEEQNDKNTIHYNLKYESIGEEEEDEDVEEAEEEEVNDENDENGSPRRIKRLTNESVTTYNEMSNDNENSRTAKRTQRTKRKTINKRQIINRKSNLNRKLVRMMRKGQTDSEDDVIKEMDVAMKKPRKQYAKLPKTVPCTMCDAMFGTERTLKIHMHQVHGIKERHICPICSREFKIGGNLKQHIETHSDYKRFICNYCGKGFHLPYNLKEHMNTHTGARPYKCETCGKTFGRNTLRQAHMRIHTGEKPYKCTEENCDRAYAYQTDLKRHRRSVHGIITKTFPCPICAKVFYENKFLTKHLNVHQGNA